ncbi:MAG: C39 family peptidase [Clostridium sp.]
MKTHNNKRKVINKKRKISKRRRRQIRRVRMVLALSIILLIFVGVKFKNVVFSDNDSENLALDENREKVNIAAENKLENNSVSKLNKILKSPENYPATLIDLANNNEEAIDFVYNYTKNKDKDYKINPNDFNIKKGEIQSFIQWDKRWGYKTYGDDFMGLTGCAPTSLAMVISSLNNDKSVTPPVIAKYAEESGFYVDGIGSSWTIVTETAKKYGLKTREIPKDENTIRYSLQNGNPIIVSVGPGTFTESGHFLVLKGITDDGKIKINDPNSILNSENEWDIDVFLNEANMFWEISK